MPLTKRHFFNSHRNIHISSLESIIFGIDTILNLSFTIRQIKMEFPAHGSADINYSKQIIIAKIVGPWNLELIEVYRKKLEPFIAELSAKGPWGLVVCIHNSATCPPDAIELIRKGVRLDSNNNNRICTSYVIALETEGRSLMEPIWRKIYRDVMPFDIFTTLDEAINWTETEISKKVS